MRSDESVPLNIASRATGNLLKEVGELDEARAQARAPDLREHVRPVRLRRPAIDSIDQPIEGPSVPTVTKITVRCRDS